MRRFSESSKYWLLFVAVWLGANVVAYEVLQRCELADLEAQSGVSAGVIRQFDSGVVSVGSANGADLPQLHYRFRGPAYWASNQSVPLLVYLHGSGDRGFDNVIPLQGPPTVLCEAALQDQFPCCVLVPQCPPEMTWTSDLNSETDILDAVLATIDQVCTDRRIDQRRIYLAGFSMGGFGAWSLAARAPERFAAVLPIAGGAGSEIAEHLVDVPIWAVHSADDEVVSVEGTRQIVDAIRKAGGSSQYLELTDAGHGSWREVFRPSSPILEWMFEQRRED